MVIMLAAMSFLVSCRKLNIFLMSLSKFAAFAEAGEEMQAWLNQLVPANYSSDIPPLGNGKEGPTGYQNENAVPLFFNNQDLCLAIFPTNYPKYMPERRFPGDGNFRHCPAVIYCSVQPQFITVISMGTMDFEVDLLLWMEWHDLRLQYREGTEHIKTIAVPRNIAEKMWYPSNLHFDNLKGSASKLMSTTDISIGHLYLDAALVHGIGIRVTKRRTARFICDLDFTAYPFDVQRCEIRIRWISGFKPFRPVQMVIGTDRTPKDIPVPPGYRLASVTVKDGRRSTKKRNSGDIDYMYRTALIFVFEREFAQHLMLVFVPSILIVVLSWVSFWLDVETAAPRVALGMTTLLTLATQFNAAQRDLPPVSYVKAIDIWMLTCMFVVFASILEFAVANICRKLNPVSKIKFSQHVYNHNVVSGQNQVGSKGFFIKRMPLLKRKVPGCCLTLRPQKTTSRIDYVARIIFPISFLIFNIIFWIHFVGGKTHTYKQ